MSDMYNLKDGTQVNIRSLVSNDLEKSLRFFQSLSAEERLYLRVDVLDPEVVKKRIENCELINTQRIVAEIDGEIVADAGLEIRPHGWERHLADFRLIVSPKYRHQGLGMIMAEELYQMALKEDIEEMIIKIMPEQEEAKKIFSQLGFKEDVRLKNHVKDLKGNKHDLILMRCGLDDIWDKIEAYFDELEHRNMRHETH
jgi:ribosomal protein S18 acetylase RimI-like enzyme